MCRHWELFTVSEYWARMYNRLYIKERCILLQPPLGRGLLCSTSPNCGRTLLPVAERGDPETFGFQAWAIGDLRHTRTRIPDAEDARPLLRAQHTGAVVNSSQVPHGAQAMRLNGLQ